MTVVSGLNCKNLVLSAKSRYLNYTARVTISSYKPLFKTVQGVTHDHILREGVPISYNSLAEEGTSNIEPKAFLVNLLDVAPGPSVYWLMEEEPGLDSVHTAHDLIDLDHIATTSPMHQ